MIRYLPKNYVRLIALTGLVYILYQMFMNSRDEAKSRRQMAIQTIQGQDNPEAKVYRWENGKWRRIPAFCSNTGHFRSVPLKSPVGSVNMYIHNVPDDSHVSMSLWKSGIWERNGVNQMIAYLNSNPDIGFLDIGSHLGVYSLVAALLGRRVIAVDPLVENVLRFCRTVQEANMADRVTILFAAISDSYRTVTFERFRGNIGGTQIKKARLATFGDNDIYNSKFINTVHLDDILPFINFSKVLLKMDIEGHEYEALKEGRQLFDYRDVIGILMEWHFAKLSLRSDRIMELLYPKGFKAVHPVTNKTLQRSKFLIWPNDILWVKS